MADDALFPLLPQFITIPSIPFQMGTLESELSALAKAYGGTRESYREESPQHMLTLSAFAIAKTPVTNGLYARFVADAETAPPLSWRGPQPPPTLADHPVVDVTWQEAVAFCGWLRGTIDDRRWTTEAQGDLGENRSRPSAVYRLPTEAEWELMARGIDGRRFPWGEEWDPSCALTRERGHSATEPVGSIPAGASPFGCLDVAGGVWEWTASLDRPYPYDPSDGREDPAAPGRRILRGGCYANPHGYARCACRFRLLPNIRNQFLGFRLARDG
jgi:formylglycine-generating enzyme required for sulfatase activity